MNSSSEEAEQLEATADGLEKSLQNVMHKSTQDAVINAIKVHRARAAELRRSAAVSTPDNQPGEIDLEMARKILAPLMVVDFVSAWRFVPVTGTDFCIEGRWCEDGSSYQISVPYQLRDAFLFLLNNLHLLIQKPVSAPIPEAAAAEAKEPEEAAFDEWIKNAPGDTVVTNDDYDTFLAGWDARAAHDRQPLQEQPDADLLAVLNEPWKRSLINYPMHETFDHKSYRDGYERGAAEKRRPVEQPVMGDNDLAELVQRVVNVFKWPSQELRWLAEHVGLECIHRYAAQHPPAPNAGEARA